MFQVTAVMGATGAVGSIIRQLMEERNFPTEQIKFLASKRSAGKVLPYAGKDVVVEEATPEAFDGVDLVISSTPDDTAAAIVPLAVAHGCIVVDESAYFRMKDDVPLVIPEVNPDDIMKHKGIIASPNCSTTQMVQALEPLHRAAKLLAVEVCTYQATSGAGEAGKRDLVNSSKAFLEGKEYQNEVFPHPIAFNVIPQIGSHKYKAQWPGYTSEEVKMIVETWKMLGDDTIKICPTCVRVPVSNCHSEVISVQTARKVSVAEAKELWAATPGLVVMDDLDNGVYPMPCLCTGSNDTYLGRVREDYSRENGLVFWCVSDNLRKGAATNAVQIAELLARKMFG
ncbi:MAG: aspartate-semialdehyde dehydrogenase [Planctomycetia bacterium]|nr:aspartate-semialdehyde dehydrogenase [Planctomycetia bacterium]